MSFIELTFLKPRGSIIGLDEVGRGPIAGPVVACAVQFSGSKQKLKEHLEKLAELNVTDSKKLNKKKRNLILNTVLGQKQFKFSNFNYLREYQFSDEFEGLTFSLQKKSPQEIEVLNILWASMEAMGDCCEVVCKSEQVVILVDGNKLPKNLPKHSLAEAIVKGDEKSVIIGMASIIAKEFRDQLMEAEGRRFPEFDLAKNSGYPTPAHKEALLKYGKTPIHRNSFKTVLDIEKKYGV
jgi:ribonuclease HII